MSETKVVKKRVIKKKVEPTVAEQMAFLIKNEVALQQVLQELKIEVTKIPPELKHTSKCAYNAIAELHQDLDGINEEKNDLKTQ